MSNHILRRRPTWGRYAIIIFFLSIGVFYTNVRHFFYGVGGFVPISALVAVSAAGYIAYSLESGRCISWDGIAVKSYSEWLGWTIGKVEEVRFADIVAIDDGRLSIDPKDKYPFTTVPISDGNTTLLVRLNIYYREGIQALLADIARARPDLPLTENLKAFMRGDFNDLWVN